MDTARAILARGLALAVASLSGARLVTAPAPWPPLVAELDLWETQGLSAGFWLRDDDAVAAGPALERLAGLSEHHGVAVLLAVIPMLAQPSLVAFQRQAPLLLPCQHGAFHRNHAAAGRKNAEFGAGRAIDEALAEIAAARAPARRAVRAGLPAGLRAALEPDRSRHRGTAAGTRPARPVLLSRLRPGGRRRPGSGQQPSRRDRLAWRPDRPRSGEPRRRARGPSRRTAPQRGGRAGSGPADCIIATMTRRPGRPSPRCWP